MSTALPDGTPPSLSIESSVVSELLRRLRQSLELRISNIPEPPNHNRTQDAKLAVLFSGGLDCTLLARISHEILPPDEPIDLLNVAFENPRVAAAAASTNKNKEEPTTSVYETCPDRMTGRSAFAELQTVCPSRRWRLVAIDVPYTETLAHRDQVKRLMRPHNTEMDLSIACALYFASRGEGTAYESSSSSVHPARRECPYTTPSRTLLSGLGADELFAGYGRHGIASKHHGFAGLVSEIALDVNRLGKRNLGRDDRVLCHWAREARYPFLDEEFVAWVVRLPVWERCGFGSSSEEDEDLPEKKALRLVARQLGLQKVSCEKKRAIQFGARTAKMEKGRTRGTDALV